MTTTPETLSSEQIAFYRENGFVHVPGIITPDEAARFRGAALAAADRLTNLSAGRAVFAQFVNVWQQDDAMRALIRGEWWHSPTPATTDDAGSLELRGFAGTYRITGSEASAEFELGSGSDAVTRVTLGVAS